MALLMMPWYCVLFSVEMSFKHIPSMISLNIEVLHFKVRKCEVKDRKIFLLSELEEVQNMSCGIASLGNQWLN